MSRVLLIHGKPAEAEDGLQRLRAAGHQSHRAEQGRATLRTLGENPPDAFVIDLRRQLSHGRAVATPLRQQKATRLATMDACSGTALAKKLGIRIGSVVALLAVPGAFEEKLAGRRG